MNKLINWLGYIYGGLLTTGRSNMRYIEGSWQLKSTPMSRQFERLFDVILRSDYTLSVSTVTSYV